MVRFMSLQDAFGLKTFPAFPAQKFPMIQFLKNMKISFN